MQYGDLGKRVLASIIDSFILFILLTILGTLFFMAYLVIPFLFIAPFVSLIYYVLMEGGSWHGTLGKHMMGQYVADENGFGITYSTAMLRSICKIFSGLCFGIGYLIGFFNESKQCLHDMMAKTYVLDGVPHNKGYNADGSYSSNLPELVCVSGPLAGSSYVIPAEGLLIGRDSVSCQVVIPSSQKNISRIHCLLTYNKMSGMYVLNDRNSSCGTFLYGGTRVQYNKPAALSKGDKFYLATPDVVFEVR